MCVVEVGVKRHAHEAVLRSRLPHIGDLYCLA
jgi:hypothetical protein